MEIKPNRTAAWMTYVEVCMDSIYRLENLNIKELNYMPPSAAP